MRSYLFVFPLQKMTRRHFRQLQQAVGDLIQILEDRTFMYKLLKLLFHLKQKEMAKMRLLAI